MGIIKITLKCTICFIFYILDGRPQWEVEAKIIREKSQGVSILLPSVWLSFNSDLLNDVTCFLQSCIVVEVPPYHSKTVASAVQVQFYVCNGKRKRSQSQRFTYLSGKTLAGISQRTFSSSLSSFFWPLIQTYRRSNGLRQVRLESTCSSVNLSRACVHSFGSAASCLLG